ncbi:peptide ABC transporter substrate-binding protein [Qipengyuania sp. 1NDH17]|uniref:Peptide ABC transporter substrate-binding protein n=1 Tax=Qipengyuania polymorpha TaxID=2867234 RepID=A0ABS7J661_9SPHN|nr:ABC transporter substrate-binding protein [Qipengyuania polymorpha]MBX7458933.1 peptide ABC transporter substrate-binding protein [Qipengyuania polymorpha]
MRRALLLPLIAASLASCSGADDDGLVEIAYLGDAASLYSADRELSEGAALMRSAQRQGLVRFNEQGEVVPALAERWIITDDGTSYIFRIREFDLPDGSRLTARAVAEELGRTLSRFDGTSLGLDLEKVLDIRAMTGRVIEIRLRRPMPGFLSLLAQPELGIALREGDVGPMKAQIADGTALFEALRPEERGLSEQDDWDELVNTVLIRPLAPRDAARAFAQGEVDVLLGGRLETLPLAITGALSRGTVRLDSAIGLYGLDVAKPEGFLASAPNREALAMAIDRPTLAQQFNLGGWAGSSRIVAAGLPGDDGTVTERWQDLSLEQRRARASAAVERWRDANGAGPQLSVYLPRGPGSTYIFRALERDMALIGIRLARAQSAPDADLRLRDSVARYPGARWFLNQFNCEISAPVCSADADFLVQLSLDAANPAEEASYLSEAEQTLTATNLYIPLGSPIRWSQVRAGVEGFSENAYAFHPLFPLSRAPI